MLLDDDIARMPWNIRRAFNQVNAYGSDLFLHVASFLCRGVMVPDKALSFHAKAVGCFKQGQARQGAAIRACLPVGPHRGQLPLGRSVYLGADGRQSLGPSHDQRASKVCGQDMLASCGMDKGYYSNANHKYWQS